MSNIQSYPKIYALGHAAIPDVWEGVVSVEEKVDGSQFSFGVLNGRLVCRSKGATVEPLSPQKLFAPACENVLQCFDAGLLEEGRIYRGEALHAPKHNTLKYGRAPKGGLVLFDVSLYGEHYVSHEERQAAADRLGVECIPQLYLGEVSGDKLEFVKSLLDRESFLGEAQIEGVVVKNYQRFGKDGRAQMGKFVREEFKEANAGNPEWKKVTGKDIKTEIGEALRTEARFRKAIQHLRDAGQLDGSPKDIGPLFKELARDIEEEEGDRIKELLMKWARKDILRIATHGFPQWYKEQLLKGEV